MIKHIVNLNKTITSKYFKEPATPWDVLNNLNSIIDEIDKSKYTEIKPNIWVGKNVKIADTANIIGPCIIGNNSEIKHCAYIRENVIIGKKCTIGNSTEVKNSILFDEVAIPHFNYVGNSILGYKSHFGAGAITSNLKSDKTKISITINDITYKNTCKKFGAIVGDNVEIGCNSVLTPGTVIGKNTTVYPLTMVRGEIKKNKIVKDKKTIVDKKLCKKKKHMKIYIDFDGTLFNTTKLITNIINIFEKYNIDKTYIEKLYLKEKNLDNLITKIIKKKKLNPSIYKEFDKIYSKKLVYKDVIPFLEKNSKKYDLILLTLGDIDYQTKKIEYSSISKYFKDIIITDKDKSKLNIDYQNGIFIDNNPLELKNFYKSKAKYLIRIKRDSDKYSKLDSDVKIIPEFTDFDELTKSKYLKKIGEN